MAQAAFVAGEPAGTSSRSGFGLRTLRGRAGQSSTAPPRQPTFRQGQQGARVQPGAEPGSSEGMPEAEAPEQLDPLSRARQASRTQVDHLFEAAGHRLSPIQFNADAKNAVSHAMDMADRFNYFRHAGFGAAIRYAVGAPQMTPTMARLYRDQALRNAARYSDRHPGYWAP